MMPGLNYSVFIRHLIIDMSLGIFSKIKEGENHNHRNTLKYFEDYNLSLTWRLGKITVFGRALTIHLKGEDFKPGEWKNKRQLSNPL
jgi:hypothetical protein